MGTQRHEGCDERGGLSAIGKLPMATCQSFFLTGRDSQAEPAYRISLDHGQADSVPEKISDVVDSVKDHRRPAQRVAGRYLPHAANGHSDRHPAQALRRSAPFQRQSPRNHGHVLRQTHRPQHLRPEHAGVSHLNPLAQLLRVAAPQAGLMSTTSLTEWREGGNAGRARAHHTHKATSGKQAIKYADLKISMLGSVYGLYAGLKRSFGSPRRVKNRCSVPIRSPSVSPRSHTTPALGQRALTLGMLCSTYV